MNAEKHRELVLALYPFTRGLAFALFEAPLAPVDWGIKEFRGSNRNARSLKAATTLMETAHPDIVVMEDSTGTGARRAKRIMRLHQLIANLAASKSIELCSYRKTQVHACFRGVGATSRYEIAQVIATQVMAFAHRLPATRRIWESENPIMSLFYAAALAMTHFSLSRRHPAPDA